MKSLPRILFPILIGCYIISCENSDSKDNNIEHQFPQPAMISYTLMQTYPHDTGSFTQGLEIHNRIMYESTGNPDNVPNNGAWIGKIDITTGKQNKKAILAADYFGEGITILNNKIYRLTWQNQKAFVYALNDFKLIQEFSYQGEGWGLTHDGTHLIMSNGSNILSYRDPDTFNEVRQIYVQDHTGMKNNLNELEFIEGYVYANVWQTNQIIKIDTATGNVTGILDLTEIIRQDPALYNSPSDVLNGIAWDSTTKRIYVTGKKWPKLLELKFN